MQNGFQATLSIPVVAGGRSGANLALLLTRVLVLAAVLATTQPSVAEQPEDAFSTRVQPLLHRFCVDCHSQDNAEANVRLDGFHQQADALKAGATWLRVLDALEGHVMPPTDAESLGSQDRAQLIDWIENDFVASQCGQETAAASVVMRRLNREEYNNTLRDLLGIELDLAKDFPQDEIGFGFDNVGSALNLSPIHVEKLLAAAEVALNMAIVVPSVDGHPPIELIGLRTYPLAADEVVQFEHTLKPGRYLAEFSLVRVGIAEEVPPPLLEISFGSDKRKVQAVRVQDETVVYRYWLNVAKTDNQVTVSAAAGQATNKNFVRPKQVTANVSGDQRYGGKTGLHVDSMVVRGPIDGSVASLKASHRRIFIRSPLNSDQSRANAAAEIIQQFTQRAFRRPVSADEVDRLLQLYQLAAERGESFERAVQIALTTTLVSPQFLFLVEPEAKSDDRLLNDFELAGRLSYFLWSSMPDEDLLELAARGELRENLRSQVARMLSDPKSAALVSNFSGQWLQLRKLSEVTPDRDLYPAFTDQLRNAMREETETFFAFILHNNRSVLELLDSDYTFLNAPLAQHYGIDGVEGLDFRQVALADLAASSDRLRGGVLTQASILTLTSNPNRTSPVKRGKWILQQILGTPPPPPPADVETLDESAEATETGSLRDRLELHRQNPVCASCHDQMDPIGFALENFDAIGRWRDMDDRFAIEPSGELAGGLKFKDVGEFKQLLRSTGGKRFCRCIIENLLVYALGRGLQPSDLCIVESIRKQLESDDYRMHNILIGIVESDAFQYRGVLNSH